MMHAKQRTRLSKFLSFVLRHHPEEIGVELDDRGWVDVDLLLARIRRHRHPITLEQLEEIVATNEKQRFAFSDDGQRIRASQGHSVDVDLGYQRAEPHDRLFHGTVSRFLGLIREEGLLKGDRHHVHLSPDERTARKVGSRRGRPVILIVQAASMHEAGHEFYLTPNRVWLTETVPCEYIEFP